MSSHHSQKFFDLHHKQVAGGRERKRSRFLERLELFKEQRGSIKAEVRRDYLIGLTFACLCFVYIVVTCAVYLNHILSAYRP